MEKSNILHFKIVTPERVVYESDADYVTIPTQAGEITVYPEHAPMVSIMQTGELTVHKEGRDYSLSLAGGVLEIRPDSQVIILADTAERAEDIDIERAETAQKRAEELLKNEQFASDFEFATMQAQLEKELARIQVAKRWKARH